MYRSIKRTAGTRYELTDTDFVIELDVAARSPLVDSVMADSVMYWNAVVECYENHSTNLIGNLFLALKDHEWFDPYPMKTSAIYKLFDACPKLATYREGIEKLMLLM
jgi:hypothetical protein